MSYTKLWNNTDIIIKQSHSNRLIFDSFILAAQRRVEIEEGYARQLQLLAESCNKIIKKEASESSLLFVMSAFKSNVGRRAAQTLEFTKQLKEDIILVLKEFIRKQYDQVSWIEKQFANFESIAENHFAKMRKCKSKINELHKIREEEFIHMEILKARILHNKEQEQKQVNKARKAEKQYLNYEATAKDIIKQYNTFIGKYYTELDKKLLVLERHEVERFDLMNDSMKKILVFQVSMMKNFQYDVTNLSTQLESAGNTKNKDVEDFVSRNVKQQLKKVPQSLPRFNFINAVISGMLTKDLDNKIKFDKNQEIRVLVAKISTGETIDEADIGTLEKQKISLCQKIFQYIKKDKQSQVVCLKQKFSELFDASDNRNLAQLCLRTQIQHLQFETNEIHFKFLDFLLQKCYKKKDVFCIRAILRTIFTQLTMKTPERKNQILYGQFINSKIWKDDLFWNAFLFESVQEHLKIYKGKKKYGYEEAIAQQRNIILSQIMHSCHIMLMLGYSACKVKKIAEKFIQYYNIYETESVKIFKLINQSSNSYSQIWINECHQQDQEIEIDFDID